MTDGLDRLETAIVNGLQGGFPIADRPFAIVADALERAATTEPAVIEADAAAVRERVADLVDRDVLSRFGPLIDADAIGGRTELVAMSVPDERFDAVADSVNAHQAVSHNYRRDHDTLTMWFVVSVADPDRIGAVCAAIEDDTGLETYRLPKLTEFHVGARFPIEGPLAADGLDLTDHNPAVDAHDRDSLTPPERALLLDIQDGLPVGERPYATIADAIGRDPAWVRETLEAFRRAGIVRRIGAVPNHYALGYSENGMTVWDVSDESVEAVGEAVAALPFVTHCYERPRHEGVWPYNIFAMVHGRSDDEIADRIDQVYDRVADHCAIDDRATLYSTAMLKKTGFSLDDRTAAASDP
ncbi:MAG: Lrp/AsnC family transcriptional regulator [Halococcoides sp.]